MANSLKKMRDNYREYYIKELMQLLRDGDCEDVVQIASNAVAFPIILEDGVSEDFIKIVVSIPTGSKDEPFDAYSLAEEYQMKLISNAEKKEAKAKAKAEKIERDKRLREKKKAIHEKGEQ